MYISRFKFAIKQKEDALAIAAELDVPEEYAEGLGGRSLAPSAKCCRVATAIIILHDLLGLSLQRLARLRVPSNEEHQRWIGITVRPQRKLYGDGLW